jgi:hypothetical protein
MKKRLGITLIASAALTVVPLHAARAESRPVAYTLDPAWGRAEVKVVRTGWSVNVNGWLTDTRDDGDCVYVEAVLEVDHWFDPDSRIPDQCENRGTRIFFQLPRLTPGKGSRLSRIRVRVCAADALKDSCRERTDPVPGETARRPEFKSRLDAYLDAPMEEFKRVKAQRPEPYDWRSDACSNSPDRPAGFDFTDACDRHDFGYRNYGKGELRANPTDAQRAIVDARLKADLLETCERYRWERDKCRGFAQTYHDVVRKAGGKPFYS